MRYLQSLNNALLKLKLYPQPQQGLPVYVDDAYG